LFGLVPFLRRNKSSAASAEEEMEHDHHTDPDAILLETSFPLAEHAEESIPFKLFRYSIFFLCFIFWPAGIPRRKVEYKPLPMKPETPSLLQLVFEAEALQHQQ
jgi:hypothetical protein